MVQRFGIIYLMGLLLLVGSAGSALAFGPVDSGRSVLNARSDLQDISFWGQPYPYGFTNWGPCIRYVEVETRWGWRLRRVWVCR
ncbi:MAG: hypothetical protein KGL35_18485 [Bradyrhizobium sp.]|nr:hypothetical protein [Bradyrhizobium sp.]